MEANLPATPAANIPMRRDSPPYSNWGPWAAIAGFLGAFVAQYMLAIPILIVDPSAAEDDPSTTASVLLQLITTATFLAVPLFLSASQGARGCEVWRRLGLRGFDSSAFAWMAVAFSAYLAFAAVYVSLVGAPEQEDIADLFGPLPVQILLIVFAAGFSEEVCFRGMLFGGLRERLSLAWAALISATIFGLLHLPTGASAVPQLIVFGLIMALLYEKTGSIIPGILLHMLNNSLALLAQ